MKGPRNMDLRSKNIIHDQSGAVLVIALLIMIVLTVIGLAAFSTGTLELMLSGNKRGATDAFYAADSGIQVVTANIKNFDLPDKYIDDKYDPFTDSENPNPTEAKVMITHLPTLKGVPRGSGFSATNFDFEYYSIRSTGQDRTELSSAKSTCTLEQKVVRLVPTLQGGY
jgi:hypothetical protein